MARSCSQCGEPASHSVNSLVSTLGAKPRRQKCSRGMLLCKACIHAIFDSSGPGTLSHFIQSLRQAYTALADDSKQESR
jgi:hypothetical protein